mmetsp:Transcript_42889/g.109727  ORF Transcript_42889/g.109727 Transcript_42889/m.109727 type:complete len:205 (+) Transcript_42889:261-875(+)
MGRERPLRVPGQLLLLLGGERHVSHVHDVSPQGLPALRLLHQRQALHPLPRPQRDHQPAADAQLLEEGCREGVRRGAHVDAVEGRLRRDALPAVAFQQNQLAALQQRRDAGQRGAVAARLLHQPADVLNADSLPAGGHQLRKDRREVAAAAADIQDLGARLEPLLQILQAVRMHVWRCDPSGTPHKSRWMTERCLRALLGGRQG